MKINFQRFLTVFLGIALIVAIGTAFYFFREYSNLNNKNGIVISNDAPKEDATLDEVQVLVAKIGKFIDLPQGETPTVATVSDPDKLKSQTFFAKAKKGDKVLIYTNAKKAILYDPTANKILEMSSLSVDTQVPNPSL